VSFTEHFVFGAQCYRVVSFTGQIVFLVHSVTGMCLLLDTLFFGAQCYRHVSFTGQFVFPFSHSTKPLYLFSRLLQMKYNISSLKHV
jgi:hypothetical protein